MAGAVNIKFGLSTGGVTSGVAQMRNEFSGFSASLKTTFNGLGNITAPVVAGLGDLGRQLAIAKHQVGDLVSTGGLVPADLIAKYRGLQAASDSVRQALAQPVASSAFTELNAKLTETKAKVQDVLASGGTVSPQLANQLRSLQSQVASVNAAVNPTPALTGFAALNQRLTEAKTKIQDLVATGQQVPRVLMAEFRGLEGEVNRVGKAFIQLPSGAEKLSALGSSLQSFGRQASILAAGIALIGVTSFKSYADINALQLGLQNITGSAAGAEARFKELMPVIKLPGLGLEEAVKGDVRLQAVGFSAKTAKDALLQFGNAIAKTGGGKFELDNVITQLTQMGSSARVLSTDLKPILTSSPAVAKAVKEMFGTVSSEEISAKLQAAGRGPQEFIQDLIAKLSQLERVSGGPKNALENFGDSIKIAQFELGKAADNAFNLTQKIDGLGNFLGRTAEGFGTLSTGAQVSILGVTGLAAAVGPLSLAIGGFISLVPTLTTGLKTLQAGFLFLTGPVGAVSVAIAATIAAVAVLGNAVSSFDANLGTVADRNKLLAETSNRVAEATANEAAKLASLVSIARDETISKKARLQAIVDLNALSPQYLGGLKLETIQTAAAANAISQYSYALTQKAKVQALSTQLAEKQIALDRAGAKSAKEYVDRSRFSSDVIAINIKTTASFSPQEDREKEFEKLGKQRKEAAVKLAQSEANTLNNELKKAYADASKNNIEIKAPKIVPFDYSAVDLGGSGIKKLKDQLKAAKDAVDSFKALNPGKVVPSELLARYKDLSARVKDATSATTKHREETHKTLTVLENLELALKLVNTEIEEKHALGLSVPASVYHELDNINAAIRRTKGEAQIDLTIKPLGTSLLQQNLQTEGERISSFTAGLNARFNEILKFNTFDGISEKIAKIRESITSLTLTGSVIPAGLIASLQLYSGQLKNVQDAQDAVSRSAENMRLDKLPKIAGIEVGGFKLDIFDDSVNTLQDRLAKLNADIQGALQSTASGALTGMGELIGGLAAGVTELSSIPAAIGSIFADLAKTMGSALIAFGTAGLAAKAFLTNPITAVVAGVALVALGAGLQATLKSQKVAAFANGGLVYGPTLGWVGEGVGTTKNNPEVIAPLDKLKTMIGGRGGGSVHIAGELTARGSDLVYVFDNHNEAQQYWS